METGASGGLQLEEKEQGLWRGKVSSYPLSLKPPLPAFREWVAKWRNEIDWASETEERWNARCCIKLIDKPWYCLNVADDIDPLALNGKILFGIGRHLLAFLNSSLHQSNLARFCGCLCSLGLSPKGITFVMFSFLPSNIHYANAF